MGWFDILKNIQIGRQRGKTKDIRLPPKEDPDDDCFEYFYKLVKLIHPSFELERQVYADQSENFWCEVRDSPLEVEYSPLVDKTMGGMTMFMKGQSKYEMSEFQIIYTKEDYYSSYHGQPVYHHSIHIYVGDDDTEGILGEMEKFSLVSEADTRDLQPLPTESSIEIGEKEMNNTFRRIKQYLGV